MKKVNKSDISKNDFITVDQAIKIAKSRGISITKPTVIRICKKHSIGYQINNVKYSHWVINRKKWEKFIFKNG